MCRPVQQYDVTGLAVCYVGNPSRALDAAEFIERQSERDIQVITAPADPDRLAPVLGDDRVDALICGGTLDAETRERVVDAVDTAGAPVPVFDLADRAVPVPGSVDHYHLYPGTDPGEAVDRLVSTVDGSAGDGDATGRSPEWTRPVFQGIDAYLAVDAQRRVTAWDPALADWFGVDLADAVGRPLAEVFPPADAAAFRAACDRVGETGEPETADFRSPTGDWLRVRVAPDGRGGMRCFVRDVSDRKAYQAEVEATRERFERTIERVTDAFFVLDSDERFVMLNSRAEALLDVDADEVVGRRFWDAFSGSAGTVFYRGFTDAMDTQEPTSFEEYYEPRDGWIEVNAYPSEDGLSVFLQDVTDRVRLRQKLEALHERTRRLMADETDAAIAEDAVSAAVDVLGFPQTACWRYDGARRRLEPIARSEALGSTGTVGPIEPGSDPGWTAYDEEERRLLEGVSGAAVHCPGDVDSALFVPLGEYGLLGVYDDEQAAFDETDVELVCILVAAVESAMARAERERELERRNERLDDFASTVSHDLRSPLHVASLRTELAQETGDHDHLEIAADALDRMETLVEDLLARARGQQDLEREAVSLSAVASETWGRMDTRAAELVVESDATFEADPIRLAQAFENLFRNAIEHAGPEVTVRVGARENGFYVADDGPGILPDCREEVFEQGVTHADEGTGYGLTIVADIVRSHDWVIAAAESAEGGARFEVNHVDSLTERRVA